MLLRDLKRNKTANRGILSVLSTIHVQAKQASKLNIVSCFWPFDSLTQQKKYYYKQNKTYFVLK